MGAVEDLLIADRNQLGAVPALLGSLDALANPHVVAVPAAGVVLDAGSPRRLGTILDATPVTPVTPGRVGLRRPPRGPVPKEQAVRIVPEETASLVRAAVLGTGGMLGPSSIGLNLFGTVGPQADLLRADAVDTLTNVLLAGLAPSTVDGPPGTEIDIDHLMRLAFGAELLARTGRAALLGRDVPLDIPDDLPIPFGDLEGVVCFQQIRAAAAGVAAARTGAAPQQVGVIQSIAPQDACATQTLTITGTGFGTEGVVVFTGVNGALIVDAATWSDTVVTVVVPDEAQSGPIGLYQSASTGPAEILATASADFVDAMGCLGPAAQAKAAGLQGTLGLPPLQLSLTYQFHGGRPVIRSFTIDGATTKATRPAQKVTLAWDVRGTKVTITPGGGAPPLPAAAKLDASGRGSIVVEMPHATVAAGTYTLKVENPCASTTAQVTLTEKQTIAFALGGGGARGDFQLGALRYLSGKGIKPDALVTTSVGSVNGLQLAHGDRGGTTAQSKLESTWLTRMTGCADMFTLSPLTRMIRDEIEKALPGVVGSAAAGAGVGAGLGLVALGPFGLIVGLLTGTMAGAGAGVDKAVKALLPLIDLMTTDGPPVSIPGTGVTVPRSGIYSMSPLRALMVPLLNATEVATSGIELRMIAIALDDSSVVAIDQKGAVWAGLRGRPLVRNGQTENLIQGALASSAMPAMFEAQTVGSLNCVDGGVREVIPVRVAVDDLGASTVYAINCSAPVPPRANAKDMSMLSVFGRGVANIPFTEIAEDDTEPYGGWPDGVRVHNIRPSFDVHDGMVIEPGLIRVSLDYGWMRAADVLDPPAGTEANARVACDRIIRLRAKAWELEHHIYAKPYKDPQRDPFSHVLDGGGITPNPLPASLMSSALAVRALKTEIRDACRDRVRWGGRMPPGYEMWFQEWEFHGAPPVAPLPPFMQQGWIPPDANPWAMLNAPGVVVPPAPVPPT